MTGAEAKVGRQTIDAKCCDPFDLALSLRAMNSFARAAGANEPVLARQSTEEAVLRLGVRLDERPALVEIRQVQLSPPVVRAEACPAPVSSAALRALTERVVNARLDLKPFYRSAAEHPVLGPLTRRLHGLKGFRPASLFEMLVTAVTEQQISLLAARHIRLRLVEEFGGRVDGELIFPPPAVLARTSPDELMRCGLSRRKAEYVIGVAKEIETGRLDLEELENASNDEVRTRITSLRGLGPWSAEYVLIRGLGRPDAVPVQDLGVRSVIGRLLGEGSRPTVEQATTLLAPFAPYQGLAAFYLLVATRLSQ